MARQLYVDSSAYLCVLLGEAGSEKIGRELAGARLVSSVLLLLESTRTLVWLSRQGLLRTSDLNGCLRRVEDDSRLFALREVTVDLCIGTEMPLVTTPRSLDLAHIRTAVWFHRKEPLSRFVTLDEPQRQAAQEIGLPV